MRMSTLTTSNQYSGNLSQCNKAKKQRQKDQRIKIKYHYPQMTTIHVENPKNIQMAINKKI